MKANLLSLPLECGSSSSRFLSSIDTAEYSATEEGGSCCSRTPKGLAWSSILTPTGAGGEGARLEGTADVTYGFTRQY